MTSHPELLAEVLRRPGHDQPRLAYAAALRREGDLQGELIELEIEAVRGRLAAGPRHDRYLELRYTLSKPLSKVVCPPGSRAWLDRGMVAWVEISVDALGQQIFDVAPIQHLTLTGAAGKLRVLSGLPALGQIRSLRISGEAIVDQDMVDLVASPHLGEVRWLDIASNKLGEDALVALCRAVGMPNLAVLSFDFNLVKSPTDIWSPTELGGNHFARDIANPALQAKLESQHGAQKWLHPPTWWFSNTNPMVFGDDGP